MVQLGIFTKAGFGLFMSNSLHVYLVKLLFERHTMRLII